MSDGYDRLSRMADLHPEMERLLYKNPLVRSVVDMGMRDNLSDAKIMAVALVALADHLDTVMAEYMTLKMNEPPPPIVVGDKVYVYVPPGSPRGTK